MSESYTELPYIFDLLYDIKSVEGLHAHLTGRQRCATSGTDAELIALARQEGIALPDGVMDPPVILTKRHEENIVLLKLIHSYARSASANGTPINATWLEAATAEALTKSGSASAI